MNVAEFFHEHWQKAVDHCETQGIDLPNTAIPLMGYDEKSKRLYNIKGVEIEEVNGKHVAYLKVEPT